MSSARPSLVPRTVDFSASWADVHKCTVEILVNPLQPPSIHMVTLNQKLYFLANGPCMNLPPESQGLVSTDGSPAARAPLIIYHLLTTTFTTHLESVVAPLAPLSGTTLLTAYADAWRKYCISLTTLSAVYSYLLTMWKTAGKLNDARQIGERAWREVVFQQVKDPLIKASVDYFTFLREGVPGNARLLRTVVESHVRMADPSHQKPYHLYQSHLEASYLRNADTYLRGLVQPLQGETLVARLCRVVAALKQELKNVEVYLHSSTTKPLTKLIASAVLGEHATAFMMEFSEWIETHERRETELSALYWLISRDDNCLRALGAALTHVIVTLGRRSIETADSPTQFVAAVLNNHRRFTTLFKTVFAKNPVLWPPIRDACVAFTNENALCSSTAVAADYIASFAHLVMKRGVASKSDVDAIIDQYGEGPEVIVTLLALVSDKDVFQARYADLLASRLISGKYNEEAELQLISAVSTAVSRDYCYKWRRMLSDLESSSTLRSSFDEQRNTTEQPSPSFSGLDFRPLVLTQGSWPLQVDARAWVPPATIDAACRAFAQWFNKDRKGVRWVHSVSYGTVLPVYIKARRYEWTVTMAQLLVLNAFNTAPAGNSSVSLEELSRSSNCPADVITKAAQSLVRLKALVFDSPAMANVSLNLEYYASGLKVQMHVVKEQQSASAARVTAKVSPADAPAAPADVNRAMDDRKFAIQTAVVRIAKSRKTITFQDLVSEVIQLLHTAQFKPTIQAVKINIEALIEKEFLERKADDPNILVYVA